MCCHLSPVHSLWAQHLRCFGDVSFTYPAPTCPSMSDPSVKISVPLPCLSESVDCRALVSSLSVFCGFQGLGGSGLWPLFFVFVYPSGGFIVYGCGEFSNAGSRCLVSVAPCSVAASIMHSSTPCSLWPPSLGAFLLFRLDTPNYQACLKPMFGVLVTTTVLRPLLFLVDRL